MMKPGPDGMTELVALRVEIVAIFAIRLHLDGLLRDDGQAESRDARDLLRVVREYANRRQTEVRQDLRADAVFARVGRKAELEIRLDGVETRLLQLVGTELVEEADASPLLRKV